MSHVDEGLIHAYIDGAFPPGNEQGEEIERHIELCVDCRVRLEKARELKDRAQIVLHRLAPAEIAKPSFEEVLARRERTAGKSGGGTVAGTGGSGAAPSAGRSPTRGGRRRSSVPAMPLAWAASLVLALGAGWMAREFLWTPRLDSVTVEQGEPVSAAADRAAGASGAAGDRESGIEARARPSAPVGPPEAGRTAGASGEQAAAPPDASAADAGAAEVEASKSVAAMPPPATARVGDELRARGADAARSDSRIAASALAQPNRLLAGDRDTVPLDPVALDEVLPVDTAGMVDLRRTAEALSLLAQYVATTRAGQWTDAEAYELMMIGYETPAVLDTLQPIRVSRSRSGEDWLYRTVYRLADGSEAELIQRIEPVELALDEVVVTGAARPLPADPAAAPDSAAVRDSAAARARVARARAEAPPLAIEAAPAAEPLATVEGLTLVDDSTATLGGATVVAIRRPEGVVIVRGALPADRLRAVAGRIR